MAGEAKDDDAERELLLWLKREEGQLSAPESEELARRLRESPEARRRFYEHQVIGTEIGSLLSDRSWQLRPLLEAHRARPRRRIPLWTGVALAASALLLLGGTL